MTTAIPMPISPDVLTWARMESGYDVDRVAHRLGTKEDRILAWGCSWSRIARNRCLLKVVHLMLTGVI